MCHQIVYRPSRGLNARHKAKMGCELGNQEREDLDLVNGKIGGGLEELKNMCQHLLPY